MSKGAYVNIPRDVQDEFYRYKMPKLVAKVEGRGNGIKTVVVNMKEIASSLGRPASYPTKYFGFELGAQTNIDDKNERYIVNGKHDQEAMAVVLDGFIEKFVLCKTCRNPETNMAVNVAKQTVDLQCAACGNLTPIDMRHKLGTFIVRNPPPPKTTKATAKPRNASATQKGEEELSAALAGAVDTNDDTWATDTSTEAVEQRRLELLGNSLAKNLVVGDAADEKSKETEIIKGLTDFLKQDPRPADVEVIKKAKEVMAATEWKPSQLMQIAFGILFEDHATMGQNSKTKCRLLRLFVPSDKEQKLLLLCIERMCEADPTVIGKMTRLFMDLYETQVLEEELIIKWHKNPTTKIKPEIATQIRTGVQKFIDWLANADEEDDD